MDLQPNHVYCADALDLYHVPLFDRVEDASGERLTINTPDLFLAGRGYHFVVKEVAL